MFKAQEVQGGVMEISCFGDSHTRYLRRSNMLGWGGVCNHASPKTTTYEYVAASAKGFAAGPASRFAYKKFVSDFGAGDPHFICLGFGQVDAEVGYYFRRYVQGSVRSPSDDLALVYDGYVTMAAELLADRHVVFKGPNPSSLRLQTQLTNYVFKRLVARITNSGEREKIWQLIGNDPPLVDEHAAINTLAAELLKERVEKAGYKYFDVREGLADPLAPGLARWEHITADSDVHLVDSYLVRKLHFEGLFGAFGQD